MAKMKAAYITRLGGSDVLSVGSVPRPKKISNEAIVRVHAVGLNWLDVLLRTESFGLQFPIIPGSDVVGTVEECDSKSDISKGDMVVINPAIPCGKCQGEATNPDACKFVRILGVHRPGGYGSYLSIPHSQVYRIPRRLSVTAAAAFPLDYLTAWRMLHTKAKLRQGETVFIWGASGALGTSAVQIAKLLGAHVIAGAGSPKYVGPLREIGADDVVQYKDVDVEAEVKRLTRNEGVDCVFESIGKATLRTSMKIVRPHGRIVICGTRSGSESEINLEDLYYNQIEILGSRMGTRSEFEAVLSQIDAHSLEPIVADTFPLDSVRQAHDALERRQHIGKVVLLHE